MEEKGLKAIGHGFRHPHCYLLFKTALSMQKVRSRLGHSDIQTTINIYAHLTKELFAEKFACYLRF
ncbi:tyrosine-type recombinase/integrase [Enterococcus gallinarum]|uniref:tyrosine-type recombinase/integrase n=1 Tax=Enterococcus gallinarum TaxID=1353 RepID=UPI0027F0EC15|nr:tyrosine-type recombinase/integrase [Enterococcus gallinarum]